jgi:tetratricopeptide (TPR) repeat protein
VASPLGDTRANQGLLGRGNAALRSHLTGSTSAGSNRAGSNRAGSNRAGSNAAGRLRDGLSSLRSGRQGASQGALGRGNDALGRSGGARGRTGGSFAGSGSNQSAGGGGRPALPTPAIDRSVGVDRGFDRNSFGSGRGRLGRTRGNERGGRFHFGLGRPRHVPSSLGAQSPALRTGRSVYAGRRGHGRHGRSYRGGRWRSLWSSHYYYAPSTTVIEYVHVPEPLPYLESVPYVEVEPYIPQEPYVAPVPYVPNEHIGPDLPAAGLPSPQAYQPDAFDRGAEAFEAGQYREAHEWFDKAVRADPRDGEAWLGLMHTSLMLDRYADAATAIARVADLGGIGPGYDLDPREVYGDDPVAYDAAVVRLERFVARYPRDTDALLTIAFIRVARGDHALANADLQRLGGLDRTNPMVQVLANAMRPAPAQQGANAQQR